MSDTAEASLKSSPEPVPVTLETEIHSGKELREDLIATAVKFLQNQKVRQSPFAQRKAFLERKGLTKAEIDLAVFRSGTAGDEQAVVSAGPSYTNNNGPHVSRNSEVEHVVVPSGWERVKSTASVAVVLGATAYVAYQLYEKYIAPAWWGRKSSADNVCKSMDDLRRGVEELTSGMKETQQLLRNQQRTLDDLIRSTSMQRGPEEMGRLGMADVKDEIKSLKALLLNKNQFPALPATTPVIPSWQLQQANPESPSRSLQPATKSEDTKVESEKNQATEKQLNAESGICDIPSTSLSSTDGAVTGAAANETWTVCNTGDESSDSSGLANGHLVNSVPVD